MSKNKINIAQIGVGYWGPNILRNLVANNNCTIDTVVELSEQRRNYVKQLYPHLNVTNDINLVLENHAVDALVISTPSSTHYELSMKALNYNKHILVEKPMATSESEVEDIQRLSSKKNLIAMVGHTFLYNEAVKYIKNIIVKGHLGEIRYIYSQRLNLGRIRNDVDALWNLAPHDISIIQYWLNNPKPINVLRSGFSYIQKGIDDVVFLNIKYPNKVMANIHVSWLDPHKMRKMTIVGSKKMVVYDDIAEQKVKIYDKGIDRIANLGDNMDYDEINNYNYNYRYGEVKIPKINWKEPLKMEIRHFIDCIENKIQCLTDASHAKKVVKILELGDQNRLF